MMSPEFEVPSTAARDALNGRLVTLREEIRVAEVARQRSQATDEVTDFKDAAARSQRAEVADAEEQRDVDELTTVEAALRRLDGGTYGVCSACGGSIGAARLHVQPAAERCARCQSDFEAGRLTAR